MTFLSIKKTLRKGCPFFILAIIFLLALIFLHQSSSAIFTNMKEIKDLQKEREYWQKYIESRGAERAYLQFKKKYNGTYFPGQHTMAHVIGELLYQNKGIGGLIICDESFAFGCYHGFFGTAIATGGIEVVKKLDGVCLQKFGPYGTGCQHGIGHGILEYLGTENLLVGLEACKLTTQVKERFGCTSGLFMEYNTPIIFEKDAVYSQDRDFDLEKPYQPCSTTVPEQYRKSCYFELSLWWKNVLNKDYKKIGELCGAIKKDAERESCFLGFGTVAAPHSNYTIDGTILICKEMPTLEGETLCRAGASWSFWADKRYRHLSLEMCGSINDKQAEFICVKKSDLIETGEKNADI